MKVITVVNDVQNKYFILLKLSCAINQLELVVLVTNDQFISRRVKDDLLIAYLHDNAADEVVLFTDGFDAIFVSNEEEILLKYSSFEKRVVFSAETSCWPDKDLMSSYNQTLSQFKYLNSGGFIGPAGKIRELLSDFDLDVDNHLNSNQYIWTQRFLRHPTEIVLDSDCQIFCTFLPDMELDSAAGIPMQVSIMNWFDTNFSVSGNRIFNKLTGTSPCHLHFNGNSKLVLEYRLQDFLLEGLPGHVPTKYYYEQ